MRGEKRSELRRAQRGLTRAERIRMGWMGAVLVMAIVLWVRLLSDGNLSDEREAGPSSQDALLSLPQLDPAALGGVKDSTHGERVILEPDAFKSLALHAQTLFPDHLEALGEPGLPFAEMESRSGEFRGKPVRLRGEIVGAREIIRFPGGSPEYWCTIRTEEGDSFFFASLRVPENLFQPGRESPWRFGAISYQPISVTSFRCWP